MNQETLIGIAILSIRLVVGAMFFFQGYDKVFKLGLRNLIQALKTTIGTGGVSNRLVAPIATISSYVELIAGALLMVGLFTPYALAALSLDLVVVSIGFSKYKPMWDESHVFVRLTLIITLMLLHRNWDSFSLDSFIK